MTNKEKRSINDLKPNDVVKTCPYLEKGFSLQINGIYCCCHGSKSSPIIVSTEEIKNNKMSYELFVQRKKELFEGINGFREIKLEGCVGCTNIIEKQFKDVDFDCIGGEPLPGAFNIQHYTQCNERCLYCCYAQTNNFNAPEYNIIDLYDEFAKYNKLKGNNWIDFSGGEPATLKNFDEIIDYMLNNNMGTVVVYSNATIFSKSIFNGLKENKIILTTSLDTGLKSTYAHLRGLDAYEKVIDNLTKYRNSGTNGLWLKYVITEHNRTDDDMWSFIMTMLAIRPNKILIAPDFPYGDKEIPLETTKFAAKLWYLCEKYLGNIVGDATGVMGDPKFAKYHGDLANEIKILKEQNPICDCSILKPYNPVNINYNITPPTFLQQIFSVRNEGNKKVLRILGIKIKFKRKDKQ